MVAVTVDFESSPAGENSRNLCYSGIEAYDEPGYRLLDEAWLHLCTGWFRAAALRIVVETRSPLLIASQGSSSCGETSPRENCIEEHYTSIIRPTLDSARGSGGRCLVHCAMGVNRPQTRLKYWVLSCEFCCRVS